MRYAVRRRGDTRILRIVHVDDEAEIAPLLATAREGKRTVLLTEIARAQDLTTACPTCQGDPTCSACKGTGTVAVAWSPDLDGEPPASRCTPCRGTGQACVGCGGSGTRLDLEAAASAPTTQRIRRGLEALEAEQGMDFEWDLLPEPDA